MNYKLHYDRLIQKAQNRSILKSEYKEVHHIIPTCIGGSDTKENKVSLFAEEHLIAHLLLVKIYNTHDGLIHAAFRMSNYGRYTNKKFSWLRKKYSDYLKINNPMFNEETRKKMSKNRKGKLAGDLNPSKRNDVRIKISKGVSNSWDKDTERKLKFSKKFKGKSNPSAKKYKIIDNNDIEYIVEGSLKKFSIKMGVSINILRNWVNKGKIGPTSNKDNSFIIYPSKRKLRNWEIKEL